MSSFLYLSTGVISGNTHLLFLHKWNKNVIRYTSYVTGVPGSVWSEKYAYQHFWSCAASLCNLSVTMVCLILLGVTFFISWLTFSLHMLTNFSCLRSLIRFFKLLFHFKTAFKLLFSFVYIFVIVQLDVIYPFCRCTRGRRDTCWGVQWSATSYILLYFTLILLYCKPGVYSVLSRSI